MRMGTAVGSSTAHADLLEESIPTLQRPIPFRPRPPRSRASRHRQTRAGPRRRRTALVDLSVADAHHEWSLPGGSSPLGAAKRQPGPRCGGPPPRASIAAHRGLPRVAARDPARPFLASFRFAAIASFRVFLTAVSFAADRLLPPIMPPSGLRLAYPWDHLPWVEFHGSRYQLEGVLEPDPHKQRVWPCWPDSTSGVPVV